MVEWVVSSVDLPEAIAQAPPPGPFLKEGGRESELGAEKAIQECGHRSRLDSDDGRVGCQFG